MVRLCLPLSQCRGQAYDAMSGHLNGVAAQIERVAPAAVFVHCFAHCTNLCLQTVGHQCLPIRDALDLVMELSKLIRYSPKRSTLFSNTTVTWFTNTKTLCPTRWTVCTAAIATVLSNYNVLCVALEQINCETHNEYGRKAGEYLALMDRFSTFFGLK